MIHSGIEGKIIKLDPLLDDGEIFEQYTFIELLNGAIIRLFDYKILAQESIVGQTKNMVISAFIPEIEKNLSRKFFVESCIKSIDQNNLKCDHFIFSGSLVGFDETWKNPIMDIGCGRILISAHKSQLEGIETGDFLTVTARRIDLEVIEPPSSKN